MKYLKPAMTFEQQADLLLSRGLEGATRSEIADKLKVVSYYRLSAYWHPFKRQDDSFVSGTTLDLIWRRYAFDRRIRWILMDSIERVEVAIRTIFVNKHTLKHGAFGYLNPRNLPYLSKTDFDSFVEQVRKESSKSRETFVNHFRSKYHSESDLPLWMACELMSFGGVYVLYRGSEKTIQQEISAGFGIADSVLDSWIKSLNQSRNFCAHHARVWNRVFGLRPQIPRQNKHPEWHSPIPVQDDRLFGTLSVLSYLLKTIETSNSLKSRMSDLFVEFSDIPISEMGFPQNWEQSPIWNK